MSDEQIEAVLKHYPDEIPTLGGPYPIKVAMRKSLQMGKIAWTCSITSDGFLTQELLKLGITEREPPPEKVRRMLIEPSNLDS